MSGSPQSPGQEFDGVTPGASGAWRSAAQAPSLRASAVTGGLWSLAQLVANKGLSLAGTVVLLHLLNPADYAVAGIALGVQTFAILLPPFTLGDVLIARPTEVLVLMRTATRLCAAVCIVMTAILLAAGPVAADRYGNSSLVAACMCVALRPAVELALLGPQTRLRIALRFREIAVADAVTQTLATLAAIGMAAARMGWLSLIVPQIAATGLKALMYRRAAGPMQPGPRWIPHEWKPLLGGYALSGLGQYVHAGLLMSPPLVIAAFAATDEAGYFTSAFTLSTAINVVVSVSLGMVLQPIFAQMAGDPDRQAAAFMRACGTIAAVAMPICLLQAVLAGPAIRLFLPERWEGAIQMTALLSAGQAFYFAVNPAMSLLKAQGRFITFLVWQAVQLLIALGAMVGIGLAYGDRSTLPVTAIAGLYSVVSAPLGVWLCVRGQQHACLRSAMLFAKPLAASAIAVGVPALALGLLLSAGTASDILHIALVPVFAVAMYALLIRAADPAAGRELRQVVAIAALRVKGIRR